MGSSPVGRLFKSKRATSASGPPHWSSKRGSHEWRECKRHFETLKGNGKKTLSVTPSPRSVPLCPARCVQTNGWNCWRFKRVLTSAIC